MNTIISPTNITNAIAYGYAVFQRGGRDHEKLPDYCLLRAKFPQTSEMGMGKFIPPCDCELPRHASTMSTRYRNVLREPWCRACFYGQGALPAAGEGGGLPARSGVEARPCVTAALGARRLARTSGVAGARSSVCSERSRRR